MFKKSNNLLNTEKGFTIIESLVSMIIFMVLVVVVIGLFSLGIGKKNYVDVDIEYTTFERSIDTWLSNDYKENIVTEIIVDGTTIDYVLNNRNVIRYTQKEDYYYRSILNADKEGVIGLEKSLESTKIGKVKVSSVSYCNIAIEGTTTNPNCNGYKEGTVLLNITYKLGVSNKTIPVYLTK